MAIIRKDQREAMELKRKLLEGESYLKRNYLKRVNAKRERDYHYDLCMRAAEWLEKQMNCGFVIRDGFGCQTSTMEQPDALGLRGGVSMLVEVKVSRADFLGDKKKKFRQNPELGLGDFRIYACPPGIIKVSDLPEDWGLIYIHPKKVEKVHGIPQGVKFHRSRAPFKSNVDAERDVLYQFARRMAIRDLDFRAYGMQNN